MRFFFLRFWTPTRRCSSNACVASALGLLMLAVSLSACRLPTFNQLNYTRKEPKKGDLVGDWIPDKSSLREMETRGGYDTSVQTKLTLKGDGTFELRNMPDWWGNGFGQSRKGFQDYSGTWGISTYGDTGCWDLDLKPSSGTRSAQLIGQSPPYRIEFIIGDPDSNESMVFIKQ